MDRFLGQGTSVEMLAPCRGYPGLGSLCGRGLHKIAPAITVNENQMVVGATWL